MELLQILDFCSETKDIWILIGKVIRIVLIVIPVIIVLLGTLDLGKAVMAGEDKEIKEAQKMFVKRLIYGVVIFFIPYLVAGVYSLFDGLNDNPSQKEGQTVTETEGKGANTCWKCAINNGDC
jgi:hypothetical protein